MKRISILAGLLWLSITGFSQQGMYLQLGSFPADEATGQPVLAYSHGLSNSTNLHQGGGSGAGKVNVQDLSLTIHSGKLSMKFRELISQGTHVPDAKLVFYNNSKKLYYRITLTDVVISSISYGSSCGKNSCETPTENVTLHFAKIKWEDLINASSFEFDIVAGN